MSNPPKQKGTGFETEVLRQFLEAGFDGQRTAPTLPYDIDIHGPCPVDALVTRPDRGQALVTITLPDFMNLLDFRGVGAHIECKRYARFSLHTIFESKFGRRK